MTHPVQSYARSIATTCGSTTIVFSTSFGRISDQLSHAASI